MSTAVTHAPAAPLPALDRAPLTAGEWDRVQRRALLVAAGGAVAYAVVGAGLALAGQLMESLPRQFLLSYLTAWTFWLGVPLGCLVVLMVQHLTGGGWGVLLRRPLEAGARTLPLLALLSVPVLAGVPWLYDWFGPHTDPNPKEQAFWEHKHLWLNYPGFIIRTAVYFACWLALVFTLTRWAERQEREGSAFPERRFRLLSAPGLVVYGAAITFASVDWVMSLEPRWSSTIYPVLFAVGQLLTGFAFALAALLALADRPPLAGILTPALRRDLGNLLLAFVMFWAYMSLSQFLLVWVGNLPEEIPWYLRRSRGGWQFVSWALALLHFAVPFLLLLSRDVKENTRSLAAVAVGLLVLHFLDVLWWVEPAYPHEGQYFWWLLDVAAAACLGGLTVAWFCRQLRARPILPLGDPHLEEALRHE